MKVTPERSEKEREIISAHLVLAPHVMQSLPTACEVFRILTQTPASSAYSAWATSSKTRSSETSKLKADVRVWEKDGLTGRQHTYSELGGHVVCHMDGHIQLDDEVLRVLEIKSMNEASFKKFQKDGVKISHPRYYAQLQMMMGMSNIPSSFFIAVCKNNSEYHAEIVEFDELEWNYIRQRIERVLANQSAKISVDETDWRCRGCFKRGVCWEGAEVPKTCVTCQHAFPNKQGTWHCSKHDEEATAACADYQKYEPIPREA